MLLRWCACCVFLPCALCATFDRVDPTFHTGDVSWVKAYRLDAGMQPPFVSAELADIILKAGKSINFLRCARQRMWVHGPWVEKGRKAPSPSRALALNPESPHTWNIPPPAASAATTRIGSRAASAPSSRRRRRPSPTGR